MKHRAEYFEKAGSWAADANMLSLRSRRTGWTVAAVAIAIAALEALALAMLAPLKTVQPITLLVDRQTGFVQAVDPYTPRRVAADDALTNAFLAQYVAAREGFDRATLAVDYRKVALLSAGAARSTYLAQMPATSPASPFRRYPAGAVVATRIKSVSKLGPDTAIVRFDTQMQSPGGGVSTAQPWIAVVQFGFSQAPMSVEDRLVNPLGFKVLSYRRNAEAPPPEPAPPLPRSQTVETPAAIVGQPSAVRPDAAVPFGIIGDRVVELSHMPSGSPLSSGQR
jgi:type IV secretion system protein VirB8